MLGLALSAGCVLYIFLHSQSINHYERAKFADMVYGKAYKPFVQRVLLPTAVRAVSSVIPSRTKVAISREWGNVEFVKQEFSALNWEKEYLAEYAIATMLMYLSLIGFIFSIRYLFEGVFQAPNKLIVLAQFLALLCLPTLFTYTNYLYDFPTLFLFTLGLGLMVRARWGLYLALFFIACLNKETTILLTMIFAIHFFPRVALNRGTYIRLIVSQLLIFAVIKSALHIIFRANPGSAVEFHLDHNITIITEYYHLSTFMVWLALALLLLYQWPAKPLFLRHGILIMIPLLALTFFLGYLDELRDYYEAYPIMILLATQTISNVMGINIREVNMASGYDYKHGHEHEREILRVK